MYMYMDMDMYMYMDIDMYMYMDMDMYMFMFISIYIYMYIYTHIYIYIHIYIYVYGYEYEYVYDSTMGMMQILFCKHMILPTSMESARSPSPKSCPGSARNASSTSSRELPTLDRPWSSSTRPLEG